jgi:enoyl-[acyl-carrier protein] reductase II
MGTRFIATQDSDFTQMWKEKILESDEKGSHVGTSVFGPARYLKNEVSMTLNELFRRGFQEGYEEGVKLEMRGIRLLTEGKDPDNCVFLGGEVAGRINQLPSVDQLVKGVSAEAERVIQGLHGLVAEERENEP